MLVRSHKAVVGWVYDIQILLRGSKVGEHLLLYVVSITARWFGVVLDCTVSRVLREVDRLYTVLLVVLALPLVERLLVLILLLVPNIWQETLLLDVLGSLSHPLDVRIIVLREVGLVLLEVSIRLHGGCSLCLPFQATGVVHVLTLLYLMSTP